MFLTSTSATLPGGVCSLRRYARVAPLGRHPDGHGGQRQQLEEQEARQSPRRCSAAVIPEGRGGTEKKQSHAVALSARNAAADVQTSCVRWRQPGAISRAGPRGRTSGKEKAEDTAS